MPQTKAIPKEMLPLVDRPLIQYVVEEATASGIDQIIIITSAGKGTIKEHFGRSLELEIVLEQKGEEGLLAEVRRIAGIAKIWYIRQDKQLGLGHAILTVRDIVGDEPFAVFLPDDIFDAPVPVINQMLDVYRRYRGSVIALCRVGPEGTRRFGIVKPKPLENRVYQVLDMVEKPGPERAPSDLAILGRYILTPEIFETLSVTPPGKGGEIQLTDGLALLLKRQAVYGYEFEGTYYDAGNPMGLLKASVALGLKHPEMGAEFKEYVKQIIAGF